MKNQLRFDFGWKGVIAALSLISLAAACGGSGDDLEASSGHVTIKSALSREAGAGSESRAVQEVTRGQREFSANLFRQLSGEFSGKNAAISALSIHQALGMTWAGAAGETASQMADILKFGADVNAGQNGLAQELIGREDDNVTLRISNAFWSRIGKTWKDEYLDTLAKYYGAGVETLDFAGAPEDSRRFINSWVATETKDRIQDLLPPGSISSETVAVLTNAVYFKAPWETPFEKSETHDADFSLSAGETVSVPFVYDSWAIVSYAEGDGWQAVQKNFEGEKLAMLFILPASGTFDAFSSALDADKFDGIVGSLRNDAVELKLPKFKFTTSASLKKPLEALGMSLPFSAAEADFTGMTDDRPLWISEIFHKTFVALDEKEVEAAAATGVITQDSAAAPAEKAFIADRPFLFAIRDIPTGAVLFYGQLMDPSQK